MVAILVQSKIYQQIKFACKFRAIYVLHKKHKWKGELKKFEVTLAVKSCKLSLYKWCDLGV